MPATPKSAFTQNELILRFTRNFFAVAICALLLNSCATSATNSERAKNRVELAAAYIKSENYPAALRELLKAQEDDPNNPSVESALGTVYFKREKYELSEKHYLRALALKPDFTQARNDLARSYIETGRYTRAEELLKQSLDDLTYLNYPQTYANYGILEFKKNNYEKAIYYLKKSLEKDRENCETQVYLGRSFLESNDLESAISQLERAVTFCSQAESDLGHYYSAIALYRGQQTDKALLRFEELTTLFPNGPNREKADKMIAIIKKGMQ
jgi:Tfp pilus assembly protein PilF